VADAVTVLVDDCGVVIVDEAGEVVHDAGDVELCTEFCAPLDPCCPPGAVCSPPGDRFTSTRPTATFTAGMTGSATRHEDGPPVVDLSDFEVLTGAGSQFVPTTNAWQDCVLAPYSAVLYEEITNPSGYDRIKRVSLDVEMRAQGQVEPGLHIHLVTTIDISQDLTGTQASWTWTTDIYISTQAGRAPCVERVDSLLRSLVPGDIADAIVPVNIHIEADGPCPTAVTLGWNGSVTGGFTASGVSVSHGATAQGSLTISEIPWTRCNDAETADTCTGACCLPDGSCSLTTQTLCEAAGGTFYPSQPCADPSPCAECAISGRLLVFAMAGASGTAGGVTIRGVGATNGTSVWDLGPLTNVLDFEEHRGRLYAGGNFSLGSGAPGNGVVRWNCDRWEAVGQGLIGEVRRLRSIRLPGLGTVLHAFGSFTALGAGGSALRVARFDEGTGEWEPVLDGLNNVAQGGDFGSISTPTLGSTPAGTGLTVGGFFTSAGGGTPANLRRVAMDEGNDGPQWVEPFTTGANGTVYDILSHVTTNPVASHLLFLGGDFSTINAQSRLRYAVLARSFGGSSWSATPTAGFDNRVNRLLKEGNALGGTLWACGRFSGVIAFANDALGITWTTPSAGMTLANEAIDMCFGADPAGGGDALFAGGTIIDNVAGSLVRLVKVKGGVVSAVLAAAPSAQVNAVQLYDFPGFEHGARPASPRGVSRARGTGGCAGCAAEVGLVGEDDE
jgi:hypothetical protein